MVLDRHSCAPDAAASEPAFQWNLVVHAYFDVDLRAVWDAVHVELPILKDQVMHILGMR